MKLKLRYRFEKTTNLYTPLKLSIITVNLNNAAGLRKTIESVVSQTFTDYEYLIIDGSSTDGSVEIIKEYADKITYWVSEPDKGIYDAMNKGILQAKGEYLQFLNSGDCLVNGSVIGNIFNGLPICDLVYGNMIKVWPNGKSQVDKGPRNAEITLRTFYNGTLNHSSAFINHNLFSKYGLYDEELKIVSDWKFFLISCGLNQSKIIYKIIDVNYFDMIGISNNNLALRHLERENVLKELMPPNIYADYKYYERENGILYLIRKHSLTSKLYIFAQKVLIKLSAILDRF